MGGYGNPKCVCENCETIIDTATTSRDPEEISAACKALGEALTAGNTGDEQIIETVNDIIRNASERCSAIKDGTYDFELDRTDPDDEFDITEDLEESEEDRKKDEHDEKINKIIDTALSWACGAIFVAAITIFIIKFIF